MGAVERAFAGRAAASRQQDEFVQPLRVRDGGGVRLPPGSRSGLPVARVPESPHRAHPHPGTYVRPGAVRQRGRTDRVRLPAGGRGLNRFRHRSGQRLGRDRTARRKKSRPRARDIFVPARVAVARVAAVHAGKQRRRYTEQSAYGGRVYGGFFGICRCARKKVDAFGHRRTNARLDGRTEGTVRRRRRRNPPAGQRYI